MINVILWLDIWLKNLVYINIHTQAHHVYTHMYGRTHTWIYIFKQLDEVFHTITSFGYSEGQKAHSCQSVTRNDLLWQTQKSSVQGVIMGAVCHYYLGAFRRPPLDLNCLSK